MNTGKPTQPAMLFSSVFTLIWATICGRCQALGAWLRRGIRRRRVPVLFQLNATECGAACLAMVLGYHGRPTRVADVRDVAGVGRDGLSARALIQTATHFGLRMKAFSLEPADFALVPMPAIVHWDFDHFVVVERWSPASIAIVDPGSGRRTVDAEEFSNRFTGVVLACEPAETFDRHVVRPVPQWRAYMGSLLTQAPGVLTQILVASLVLQVVGLAVPVLTKIVVDQVLAASVTGLLPVIGLGLAIVVLSQMVTTYLRSSLLVSLQAKVDQHLMLGFFRHLMALPYRFFEQRTTGDLLMRLGSNTQVREILTGQTLSGVIDGSLIVIYLGFLLTQAPSFGVTVLLVAVVQVALLLGSRRVVHELTQRDIVAQANSQAYLVEAIKGIATLKASGSEARTLDHWSGLFAEQITTSVRRSHVSAVIGTMLTVLRMLAPLALLWIGARQVLNGSMTLGTMLAFQSLAASALTPLASLVANSQQLQMVGAHLERLADVLDAEPEPTTGVNVDVTGRIEIDHVSFQYDAQAQPVLRDISLLVEPGQKIALVGRTGSGKSTLAKLLLGLYEPTAGDVQYDGVSIREIDRRALRRQLGVVLQEPILFSGSIRQNIAFNDPTLAPERMTEAARLADIHDDITAFPMGYDTWLSEGGGGLSGGQRQRLALARALAHRPSVLVLDEATSSLDVATEARIERNLRDTAATRIVIAHRLSTIRDADQILFLEDGRIVERGTHDELVALNGRYAALVDRQTEGAGHPAMALPLAV